MQEEYIYIIGDREDDYPMFVTRDLYKAIQFYKQEKYSYLYFMRGTLDAERNNFIDLEVNDKGEVHEIK